MKRFFPQLASLLLTLWIGSLWMIGYLAVPILFASLPDKQLAGNIAGEMFRVSGYLQLFAAGGLLLAGLAAGSWHSGHRRALIIALVMVAMNAASLFGIQPYMADLKLQALPLSVMESALRDSFALWHGVSSALYLGQSLLAAWLLLLWQQQKPRVSESS